MDQRPSLSLTRTVNGAFLLIFAILNVLWLRFSDYQFSYWISIFDSFGMIVIVYSLFFYISLQNNIQYIINQYFFGLFVQNLLVTVVAVIVCKFSFKFIIDNEKYSLFWSENWFIKGILIWLVLNFLSFYQYLSTNLREQIDKNTHIYNVMDLKKEAELYKLRQQLQPHFLFNSLNSINALVSINPKLSKDMIQQLSLLLRHTLKKEEDKLVTVREELEDLQLYLNIEMIRFGDRLVVERNIADEYLDTTMPPFLIQPLVENAIKFGLYGTLGEVKIEIIATGDEHYSYFSIKNPYDLDAIQVRGTGFGLKSINRRLYLLYARNDLMVTEQILDEATDQPYFLAKMKIPHELNKIEDN